MSIGLKGNVDGSGAIQIGGSDAITITTGLNTTFAGTAAVPTGALYPIVSGTAVASTSGTSIDFTGIPSWVKRITVMFNGMSTNGTSNILVQIGSGSFTTSGYLSAASHLQNAQAIIAANSTAGFVSTGAISAASVVQGSVSISSFGSNIWTSSGALARSDAATTNISAGSVSLSGTLDRVRITTVNGTDTFDAGSINILYE